MRHLSWTWFEFSWHVFFPLSVFLCHDCHKHLHEISETGLWICCLMGKLTYIFEHMDVIHFHICNIECLFYCPCFWARQRNMQPFLAFLLQFAALSGIPPGVFALMQQSADDMLLRQVFWVGVLPQMQTVLTTSTNANHKDWSLFMRSGIFMYRSRKGGKEEMQAQCL